MSAQRYRKKPVEIEAWQWDGTPAGAGPIIDWINTLNDLTAVYREERPFIQGGHFEGHNYIEGQPHRPEGIFIKTLEGEMHVSSGDYVIRGVQGEFYPCKAGHLRRHLRRGDVVKITPNLRARIRAHSCFWQSLPEVVVESAAVDDEQTQQWSRESYARDLEIERKPRTGETEAIA